MPSRKPVKPVSGGMREATYEEVMNWLNGFIPKGPPYFETENGLMVKENK